MLIDAEASTPGRRCSSRRTPIGEEETAKHDIESRLARLGAEVSGRHAGRAREREPDPTPQDHERATLAADHPQGGRHHRLDAAGTTAIARRVRGFHPGRARPRPSRGRRLEDPPRACVSRDRDAPPGHAREARSRRLVVRVRRGLAAAGSSRCSREPPTRCPRPPSPRAHAPAPGRRLG